MHCSSTLHTSDVASAIHRIIDVFPASRQTQIKQQLALSLNAIVVQQLLPRADGKGSAVAVEVLLATYPIRNQIRNDSSTISCIRSPSASARE